MEKLERRTAAPPAQAQRPALRGRRPDVTGSIAPKQQDRPPVVTGWVIREVFDGRAMVENERLGFYRGGSGRQSSRASAASRPFAVRMAAGWW